MSQQVTTDSPPPRQAISADARALMTFEANKKSTGVAYLLWFLLGLAGAHRFYLGQTGTAIAQLCMFIGGLLLSVVLVGYFLLVPLWVWWLVDAFLIPGIIREYNAKLAAQISA